MAQTPEIGEHLQRLESWFATCPGGLTAFSGGVDSSLVAFLARRFLGRERSLAAISASPSLKMTELDEARGFAVAHDIRLQVVVSGEIEDPNYFTNPSNRCYYCKDALYTELEKIQAGHPGWWILNGQNTDDGGDYRPGLQAASEHAVRAPLAECGIDKAAVRALAAHFGLACWDKPASPCLASRIPYGERVTVGKLRQIEQAELALKLAGFPVSRVRHYGTFARIEVPSERIAELRGLGDSLAGTLAGLGFERIEIDDEGLVSGKLNRAIL